jgi:hypothetical protein
LHLTFIGFAFMTTSEEIHVRDGLIKKLELINYILTTPLGDKHPHFEELRQQYRQLKKKLEDSDPKFKAGQ